MISQNMARIIAKISGDGNLSGKQIMYFNTCLILIDEFKKDIKKEFGKANLSEGTMSNGTPYVAVYGKKIAQSLTSFIPSYNSCDIFIPKEITKSNKKIIKEYVRSFYDDEGCASLRLNRKTEEWKRNITLSSNSNKILGQVKRILENLGIRTNKIIMNYKLSNYDKSFVLSITGKDNFIKFKEKIGFKHPRKIKMLGLIIKSYKATSKHQKRFLKLKEKINELVVPK